MPIEIKDIDGGVGVIIEGHGVLTDADWVDPLIKHLTQEEKKFKKYRYSFSDYTKLIKADLSQTAIDTIAQYCKDASKINPKPVVAIVASKDVAYGLSRMWEILTDMTDWETEVFRNKDAAEGWIKKRVKEKYRIDVLTER